jgi:aminopeptidase YwaD
LDTAPFDCLDHEASAASLSSGGRSFEVQASPYTPGCDATAELACVSTLDELEACPAGGKILLVRGELAAEPLMPKNFPFYNPDGHRRIVRLLEEKRPAALVTATGRCPSMTGNLYPFPLIEDGDFDIPSVFATDHVGDSLAGLAGMPFRLAVDARRIPARGSNVVAAVNPGAPGRVLYCAHFDAKETTPGALDNASGTAVLLLLAEMLKDPAGPPGVEIAALNGEDHYSAAGQKDYLARRGGELPRILAAVNVDDVGYVEGRTAYSFYECSEPLSRIAAGAFGRFGGLAPGEPWFQGDHMVFAQQGVPSLALTSEKCMELLAGVSHTAADIPDLVDPEKLVEAASALVEFHRELATRERPLPRGSVR